MYVLITLGLLILATAIMLGLRLSRSSSSYSWLTSTLTGLLAWASILAWQLDLPKRIAPSLWAPASLFHSSPELLAEPYAWLYAICLTALAAAVIVTSPAREPSVINPASWAASLALTALGLLAILADNPLTLVLCWTAIDLVEFINTLRTSDSPSVSERAVVSFSVRVLGTGMVLWASVLSANNGQTLLFENAGPKEGIFLLLAAGLRLGVLPLHLTYRSEPMLRRGFGTLLRLMTAATSLILLARLPISAIPVGAIPYLLLLVVLAALYGGWMWLFASDELNGRPYWIIGMSALSLAAALRGSPTASTAWGAALLLFGGISFLYSARQVWIGRLLAVLGILMLGLPFSLTASGWSGDFPWPVLFWPLFLLSHLLLVAGYVRHLLRSGESSYTQLPTWAQSAYPLGLGLLGLTALLVSLWGWPGARQTGSWIIAIVLVAVAGLAGLGVWRFRRFSPAGISLPLGSQTSRLADLFDLLARLFWIIYRLTARLLGTVNNMLEGDGGLLWTLLLLVLFITIFRRR